MNSTGPDDDLGLAPDRDAHSDGEAYVPDDRDDRPTRKQLAYLRSLAGQTFAYPRTAGYPRRAAGNVAVRRADLHRDPQGPLRRASPARRRGF